LEKTQTIGTLASSSNTKFFRLMKSTAARNRNASRCFFIA
jgi:hypothetical protein